MVHSAWMVAAIFAFGIQNGALLMISDDDKAYGCSFSCLDGSSDRRLTDYFDILRISGDNPDLDAICAGYTKMADCLNDCPDRQYKRYLTSLFGALMDACTEKKIHVFKAIISFLRSNPFPSRASECLDVFHGAEWQTFLIAKYASNGFDCGGMPGIRIIGNECESIVLTWTYTAHNVSLCSLVIFRRFNCYIKETSSVISAEPKFSATVADDWKKFSRGLIKPALNRHFESCSIPKKMMPESCKDIMSSGGIRSKLVGCSVIVLLAAVIGMKVCFSSD